LLEAQEQLRFQMSIRRIKCGREVVAEYNSETGILRARTNQATTLAGDDKYAKRLNSFLDKCGISFMQACFCVCGGGEIQFNTEDQCDELLTEEWTIWNSITKELVEE